MGEVGSLRSYTESRFYVLEKRVQWVRVGGLNEERDFELVAKFERSIRFI